MRLADACVHRSIALGQFKNTFGYGACRSCSRARTARPRPVRRRRCRRASWPRRHRPAARADARPLTGKDFTNSTHIDQLIQSFIDWRGELNTRATWSGWLWIALLLIFKYVGRVDKVKIRGYRVLRFFKITGPILVRAEHMACAACTRFHADSPACLPPPQLCIIAIVSTKLAELHLSPGCSYYDPVKNSPNVFVPSALPITSAWNISYTPITTTDFLGHLKTYTPGADAPGCVPMIKSAAAATFLPDAVTPWGSPGNPWPRVRGLAITGTFGNPPTGRTPNFSLVSGELLTGAIVITLVASLESIAIAKALVSKHRQPNFRPSQEFLALGIGNIFGAFTGAHRRVRGDLRRARV